MSDLMLDVSVTLRKFPCAVKGLVIDVSTLPNITPPVVALNIYESQILGYNAEQRRIVMEHLQKLKIELKKLPIRDCWILGVKGEPPI